MLFQTKIVKLWCGRCLQITTEAITVKVTLDVGPRIIYLSKNGSKNILFEDKNDLVKRDVSAEYGEGKEWHIYGGSRLWLAPENNFTYYPDNSPVEYEVKGDKITFKTERYSLQLRFIESAFFESIAKYIGENASKAKLWELTACKSGGKMLVKLNAENTPGNPFVPHLNLVVWPYTDFLDPRFSIEKLEDFKGGENPESRRVLSVISDSKMKNPLKVGAFVDRNEFTAMFEYGDTILMKLYRSAKPPKFQGDIDFGANFQTYTNDLIHEIEFISDSNSITEYWKLF